MPGLNPLPFADFTAVWLSPLIIQLVLILVAGPTAAQLVPFDQPLPCMLSPIPSVKAGDDLLFELSNYKDVSCEATFSFQNSTFLPFSAVARPRDCPGNQLARIRLPMSIPNGRFAIQWECIGSSASSCVMVNATGGNGDLCQYQYDAAMVTAEVNCPVDEITEASGSEAEKGYPTSIQRWV